MGRTFVFFVAALTALAPLACASTPADAERRELYRWFDSLGFPDLSKAPLVEIRTYAFEFGSQVQEGFDRGFVVGHQGNRYTFIRPDLKRLTLTISPVHGKAAGTEISPIPFNVFLKTWQWETEDRYHPRDLSTGRPRSKLKPPCVATASFVFARVADLRGQDDLADGCY